MSVCQRYSIMLHILPIVKSDNLIMRAKKWKMTSRCIAITLYALYAMTWFLFTILCVCYWYTWYPLDKHIFKYIFIDWYLIGSLYSTLKISLSFLVIHTVGSIIPPFILFNKPGRLFVRSHHAGKSNTSIDSKVL